MAAGKVKGIMRIIRRRRREHLKPQFPSHNRPFMPLAIFTNGESTRYGETRVRECRARAEAEKRRAPETRALDRGKPRGSVPACLLGIKVASFAVTRGVLHIFRSLDRGKTRKRSGQKEDSEEKNDRTSAPLFPRRFSRTTHAYWNASIDK